MHPIGYRVPMTADLPPWEPPSAGAEAAHLAGMLDRLRYTFRWKADGLGEDGLRFALPSSTLTLGGLLKHLAVTEDDTFSWAIAGRRPRTWSLCPEGVDPSEWQFTMTPDETPAQIYALWDEAVARSRAALAEIIARGGLDEPGHLEFHSIRPSIRRHVCDLIEEYGRHTGHADLLREAFDGRVGEDPPPAWRPTVPSE